LNFTNEGKCKGLDKPMINLFSKRCMSWIFNWKDRQSTTQSYNFL